MPRLGIQRATARSIVIDGVEYIHFGGCNYLGLAQHPDLAAAVRSAIDRYGVSSSASQETTGNTRSHDRAEAAISSFLGSEAALLTPEGLTANMSALHGIRAMVSRAQDLVLIDQDSHASLSDAARSAGLRLALFDGARPEALRRLVKEHRPALAAILTDGVFAHEARSALLPLLTGVLPDGSFLVIDDCHGFGVRGSLGRGSLHASGLSMDDPRLLVTSTLAKAAGAYGGFVASSAEMKNMMRTRATPYICTTPIPPALAEAAAASVRIMQSEAERHERLALNRTQLHGVLRDAGLTEGDVPPAPVWVSPPDLDATGLHEALKAEGLYVPLISYPKGGCASQSPYLRFAVTADHRAEDLERLRAELSRLRI